MKKTAIVLLLLSGSMISSAQEWKTNLNEALKEASVQGKQVLLFFTAGNDCDNCGKLQQQVLDTPEFLSYAKEHYVMVKQDFQSKDNLEENLLIVEKYNKDGFFPLVVIIGSNARTLGQIGLYQNETPVQYVSKLRALTKG
jgi:thioredoxin-related protein